MPICEPEHHPQSEPCEDPTRRRCRHIFTAGHRCGSPCLRAEQFCYYHHTTRKPVSNSRERSSRASIYDLPNPEDRDAIRAAVAQVMQAIAHNNIDMKRAGMLLYSLQISLCALPSQPRPAPSATAKPNPPDKIVEETVLDETHGVIAVEEEYEEPEELKPRKSFALQLAEEVERYEAERAARTEQEAREAVAPAAPPLASDTWASPPQRPAAIDLRAVAESKAITEPRAPFIAPPSERSLFPSAPQRRDGNHLRPAASRNFNPMNSNSRNPQSLRQTVDILGSYGRRRIRRPDKLDRSHVAFPPGRLALHGQYPRYHRIPGRRKEALDPPT